MSDLERAYAKAGMVLLYIARNISFGTVSMCPVDQDRIRFSWKFKAGKTAQSYGKLAWGADYQLTLRHLSMTEVDAEVIGKDIAHKWRHAVGEKCGASGE